MHTCQTNSYLTKASVILSSMYIRAFTSSGFSISSHRNGMWFGSLQFLKESQISPGTDDKVNVKETHYIQQMVVYSHALTKSME
jgi:hypothetical protein